MKIKNRVTINTGNNEKDIISFLPIYTEGEPAKLKMVIRFLYPCKKDETQKWFGSQIHMDFEQVKMFRDVLKNRDESKIFCGNDILEIKDTIFNYNKVENKIFGILIRINHLLSVEDDVWANATTSVNYTKANAIVDILTAWLLKNGEEVVSVDGVNAILAKENEEAIQELLFLREARKCLKAENYSLNEKNKELHEQIFTLKKEIDRHRDLCISKSYPRKPPPIRQFQAS